MNRTKQTYTYGNIWAAIMTPNTPKNSVQIQRHIQNINNWNTLNNDLIKRFNTINLNNLNKNHILTKPITLTETSIFLKKIKSKAMGPTNIQGNIRAHTTQDRHTYYQTLQFHPCHRLLPISTKNSTHVSHSQT